VLRALRFFASLYRATVGRVVRELLLLPELMRIDRLPR